MAEIGLRFGKREAIMFAKAFIAMLAVLVAGGTAGAQQVTVTTPLYGVSDSFFESFGVGFGFGFPQGNFGGVSSDSGRSSIVGFNPFPVGFGGGALAGFGGFDRAPAPRSAGAFAARDSWAASRWPRSRVQLAARR